MRLQSRAKLQESLRELTTPSIAPRHAESLQCPKSQKKLRLHVPICVVLRERTASCRYDRPQFDRAGRSLKMVALRVSTPHRQLSNAHDQWRWFPANDPT